MAKALLPGKSKSDRGEPLCFGYNLGTCKKVDRGKVCDNGLHACTKLNCTQDHPHMSVSCD